VKLKITVDNKTYEVDVEAEEVEQHSHAPGPYAPAAVQYAPVSLPPVAPPPHAGGNAAGGDVAEDKVCRSPIVGVVVRTNAQEGQQVHVDDPLLVLEAMKMETTITSPVSAKVKKFRVATGESVQSGQVLVEFE
jgi:methylmalonyl-CoA carboxyltransferase small subunit